MIFSRVKQRNFEFNSISVVMKKIFLILLSLSPLFGFSTRWYVDQSNNNVIRNGNSWNTAVRHIGYLRNDLEDGDEVWIAEGSYGIQDEYVFLVGTYHHIPLESFGRNVSIYGGFQGNETSLNQRNPELHPTIIQPELSFEYEWTNMTLIDGFKFSGVWDPYYADRELFNSTTYFETAQVTFRNCRFENLELSTSLFSSNSEDTEDLEFILEDCHFDNVSAPKLNTNLNNNVELTGCTFQSCSGIVIDQNFFWGMHLIQCAMRDCYFGKFASRSIFENCLVVNNDFITNSASVGLYNEFRSCTVANNTLSASLSACTIANSIVYNNELIGPSSTLTNTCDVFYSIVDDEVNFFTQIQVIIANPRFLDAANGNYQLEPCSPAINQGLGTGYQAQDLAGNVRFVDAEVDLGCYEFQGDFPDRIYVAPVASGNGSGVSWANAMGSLQNALDMACPRTEVWVKQGTYTPSPVVPANRSATFLIPGGVKVYGGFSGTETNTNQRDYENNVSLLSGGIGALGNQDNSFNIVTLGANSDEILKLDGFAIAYGNANGAIDESRGGGINASFPNAEIHNCFIGFNGGTKGAGVYVAGSGSLSFENCTFSTNTSTDQGGAIHTGSIANLRPSLEINACAFQNNTASAGAAIYADSELNLFSSVFHDNNTTSFPSSGSLHLINSSPNIYNCSFVRQVNTTLYVQVPTTIRNSIFQENDQTFVLGGAGIIYWDRCLADAGIPNNNSNIIGSANFVDIDANDFRLQSNSAAINSGELPSDMPNIDRDGNLRVIGDQIDRGAFEYQVGCVNTHDCCSQAYDYDIVDDYGLSFSLECSTDFSEPVSSCGGAESSAWFKFDLPITGAQIIVNPSPGNADVQLDVFLGDCENLNAYSCIDNNGPSQAESLTVIGEPSGSSVYVRVSSKNSDEGNVNIFIFELPCQLSNTITTGNSDSCYSNSDGQTVYNQEITVTYGAEPQGGFLVIEKPLGQDQFFELTGSPQTIVLTELPANGEYISISGKFVASNYEGCYTTWTNSILTPCCQPENDYCEFAVDIPIGEIVSGSTKCATFDNWLPASCILYQGRDLWYKFVAPSSSVQIDMVVTAEPNGAVNPRFTIFSGSCNSLVEVGCGNDYFEGFDESHVIPGLVPGQEYILRASMFDQQLGDFDLIINSIAPANCPGDFNEDGIRNTGDLSTLLANFGCTSNCIVDMNDDGITNTGDLNAFLTVFGQPCD